MTDLQVLKKNISLLGNNISTDKAAFIINDATVNPMLTKYWITETRTMIRVAYCQD